VKVGTNQVDGSTLSPAQVTPQPIDLANFKKKPRRGAGLSACVTGTTRGNPWRRSQRSGPGRRRLPERKKPRARRGRVIPIAEKGHHGGGAHRECYRGLPASSTAARVSAQTPADAAPREGAPACGRPGAGANGKRSLSSPLSRALPTNRRAYERPSRGPTLARSRHTAFRGSDRVREWDESRQAAALRLLIGPTCRQTGGRPRPPPPPWRWMVMRSVIAHQTRPAHRCTEFPGRVRRPSQARQSL
jgi:hypothetical protein